ncbi:MAG: GDP-mannose 4,6-dehydratase [Candidatus Sungbacteria bacterium RIFCSPLOWO2_01_FULL_47_10]|uniref:GDP-mannose 4,6-dehydratase n=1 Tax=Candidatus Sungbacteria bacterium RIFCSPLOWO2_01_FULL_47_10 TaxID=1802276 RepID=A0A1G2L3H6_9BACT|nr:MAG: GDP-mannose 4,6-dehydratase [Candidatus Sungbacteria bacterium RIFCSPLOWO2_01_FULL_47_10]
MRALITGITGFVGSHLAEYLLSLGDCEVHGTRRHFRSNTENISGILPKITLHECDMRDLSATQRVVDEIQPEIIFHLAAQSFVHDSFIAPKETFDTNTGGNINLLEAVIRTRRTHPSYNPAIHVAGSSEEYGFVHPDEVPLKENNPLRPLSPYGSSKVAQEYLSLQYARTHTLRVVVTRAFNHTGPRRGEVFATSNFAKQIAEIELGHKETVIRHGNLDAVRDFTDVRDMVKAYVLACGIDTPTTPFNVASGTGYTIKHVLEILLSFSNAEIELKQDPSRMRPSDVEVLIGDSTLFRNATGWRPEILFEKTLEDLLNFWRNKIPKK